MKAQHHFLLLPLLLLLATRISAQAIRNPWDSQLPTQEQTQVSEYSRSVKGCNVLFLNNMGDYTVLSKQATNLTKISQDLAPTECREFKDFMLWFMVVIVPVGLIAGAAVQADLTDWVHIVEFCQEFFIIGMMNIVREPCLQEFNNSFKFLFFIWRNRLNTPKATNYLRRLFFQSCYFIENVAELSAIASIITFLYLAMITVHMFIGERPDLDIKFKAILRRFEFGMFIRMGQIMLLPFTYDAFLGLRAVVFDNATRAFDVFLAFLYCIILLGFIAFSVYTINYAPINLNSPKTILKYGALYQHLKYRRESKLISNEFAIRQILKMFIASLHVAAYFNSLTVCSVAIFIYAGYTLYVLLSFWFNGLYKDIYLTFKMAIFHFVIMLNYILAAAQSERSGYEMFVMSFMLQMLNTLMIIYLIAHFFFGLAVFLKNKKAEEANKGIGYDELKTEVDLNVS